MKQYIVYSSDTGEILRTGRCLDKVFELQAGDGESVISGQANDEHDKIDVESGEVIDK